jgi:hypothetical protein
MKCLVCDSINLRLLETPRKKFYRCNECGFSFLHPDYIPDEEAALNRYKLHHNDDDDKGYHQYLSKIIERALFYAEKPETIIDWGSGPMPAASRIMRGMGLSVFSWDPNFSSNEKPQKAFYDLGICIEVAEHFINPQKDFSTFFETLKPGAFAVMHTHLAPEDDDAFLRWWYTEDITHVSFYSKRSLKILGAKNGAELIALEDNKLAVFRIS